MNFDVESLQKQIPYYLTAEDRRILLAELQAISKGGEANYFLGKHNNSFDNQILQGDGWKALQLFVFNSGERRSVQGMILSNSCDVDPENKRDLPTRVTFAPLVKLSAYEEVLRASKIEQQKIDEKLAAIRAQKTSNVFFLPKNESLEEDHIVRLDEAHSMPVAVHIGEESRKKLFTLSNTGFYMLVFKLSVHFCRLQESVNRNDDTAAA